MKIDRIGYSDTFQVSEVNWRKIWFEAELSPGDDPEAEIFLLKEKIDIIKKKMGELKTVPIAEVLPVEQIQKGNNKSSLIDNIQGCTDVATLETFKLLVKGTPGLQQIYDKKLLELSK